MHNNCASKAIGLLITIFLITAVSLFAQNPTHKDKPPISKSLQEFTKKLSSELSGLSQEFGNLGKRVDKLEKVKKKDIWDKISSISGLVSGLLVAIIGGIAAYIYRERQLASEKAKSEREILISQIQTVQSFLPHLQSKDKREKEAALLSIAAIGNPVLAAKLADLYRDEAAIGALSKMSISSDNKESNEAQSTLNRIFKELQSSVVAIENDKKNKSSGFFISRDGFIATTDYMASEGQEAIKIKLFDKREFKATIANKDSMGGISILKIDATDCPFLNISTQKKEDDIFDEEIIALGHDEKLGWVTVSGRTIGLMATLYVQKQKYLGFLMAHLKVNPGFGGGPVLNTKGEIIGLIHSYSSDQEAFIAPSAAIAKAKLFIDQNKAEQDG